MIATMPLSIQRDRFGPRMLWLAAAMLAGSAYSTLDYAVTGSGDGLTHALLWALIAVMGVIAANTRSAYRFLFSCAFWVTVEFLFYIVLKTFALDDDVELGPLNMALLVSLLFLVGYVIGQWIWPTRAILRLAPEQKTDEPPKALYWWLTVSFIGFKLMFWVLMMAVGGGDTALEVAQATQNGGAAYLFKIPTLAQASYFLILLFAYKHGLYRRTAVLMTLWLIADGVLGAARYALVTTILINLLLCHLYVRPIRLLYLILLTPILVFVITFFGYVRNIAVGDAGVYLEAMTTFLDERELMFKLFMARLDMLPQMAEAFRLDQLHQLKNEGGMSYVYAFLHAIPRGIWPGKPPLTAAYVTEQTNPFVFADGVNIYPSIMLEGYINLLWPGALLIGVVIAKFSDLYEKALLQGSLRAQAFALMAFSFPMALINEGMHSNIFGSLIYLFAIYALWLMITRSVLGRRSSARLARP